ncbi:hypothetical protein F2Q68_00005222 [Brassica cretica]|uniref:Bacterial surface antigen (D15) domain-containing protein n=1 Tax=Brassica cretica TaxID=69181 RepID=A0A8S9JLV1_BRACR|nr:hypothetical protein F2Q68_00005222 [Brassica cretica]
MGAQKSIHAGRAKIDVNVDFTHKLCTSLMFPAFSLCIKHPNLFGGSEKLDVSWDKGFLTGGSIVGDMAPYQAFAIGGLGSVRGYGEGAVGSGRSCLVANTELALPLNKMTEGTIFLDCGTDLGSSRLVPGHPSLRHGKPGFGYGFGYGLRFKSPLGHLQVDYAINAFNQKTLYFGVTNLASSS